MPTRLRSLAERALALAVALPSLGLSAFAQTVTLRIHPRVGDTLATRFEQHVEMTAVAHLNGADTTLKVISDMLLLSRTFVQSSDDEGTVVTSVTDSVGLLNHGTSMIAPPSEASRRALQGQRVKLRIAVDGRATVLESAGELTADLQSMLSSMPATLPKKEVQAGDSWTQVMNVPVYGERGGKSGIVTTYTLDSLKHNGEAAFISLRGSMERDSTAGALEAGMHLSYTGSIAGELMVDRKRGWWMDSRVTITMHSLLTPPPGVTASPMKVETKINQRIRTAKR
jgi:hypothetical protein